MPLVPSLRGKTVAVMGLGKSGTSAVRVLQAKRGHGVGLGR